MFETTSVWNRTESNAPILSERAYNISIGLVLLWGFAVNYITVQTIPVEAIVALPQWGLLIGYFVSCFIGIMVYTKSDNPLVSFLGYNFVVLPMGVVITPFVLSFDADIISQALIMTTAFTGLMMSLAMVYPKFFLSLGRTLFISLIAVIVVELVLAFVFGMSVGFMDWIVALIFCGYIGYDWARANKIPRTLDNAVDSAASLYIDIINLFIRLLSILGRRR